MICLLIRFGTRNSCHVWEHWQSQNTETIKWTPPVFGRSILGVPLTRHTGSERCCAKPRCPTNS